MEKDLNPQFSNVIQDALELSRKHQYQIRRIIFGSVLLVLITALGASFLLYKSKKISQQTSIANPMANLKSNNSPLIINILNSILLISEIPHFDNLFLDDIPMMSVYDTLYPFDKDLIVVQANKIFEYDQINKQIVRLSDRSILDCFNDSIMINSYLYVFCQGYQTKAKRGIYVIDITQGILIKSYTDKLTKDTNAPEWYTIPNLINSRLANKGNFLWIGTFNGVFRIDTKTDSIAFYASNKLGFTRECHSYQLHANDLDVWINPADSSGCAGGVSLYDEKNNSWRTFKVDAFETDERSDINLVTTAYSKENIYLAYIIGSPQLGKPNIRLVTYDSKENRWKRVVDYDNYQDIRKLKPLYFPDATIAYDGGGFSQSIYYQNDNKNLPDISKELPQYIGISNKINGKYYLFTQNSIFILAKGEFPKFVKNISSHDNSMTGQKTFVSKDEKYAVVAGNLYGGPGFNGPYYAIDLVNIQKGTVTNLVKNNTSPYRDFSKGIFIPIANGVNLKDSTTNATIFSVDFSKQSLSFSQ